MTTELIVVQPDGGYSTIGISYEQLKGAFPSGYFDRVGITREIDIWVDDEGLLTGLEFNTVASIVARRPLYGPAVFASHDDAGETVPVADEDFISMVRAMAQSWRDVMAGAQRINQDLTIRANAATVPPPEIVSFDDFFDQLAEEKPEAQP